MKIFITCLLALSWSITCYAADAPVHAIKITTSQSMTQTVVVVEHALGRIEDPTGSTIAAEVPARIRQVLVDVGQQVQQGDSLVLLDNTDMKLAVSAAKAKLTSLQAQEKTQQAVVKRYQTLVKEKYISLTMLEQAEAQATVLKKSEQAAQSQLKQAQHNARRTRIRAPYDGIVQQRMVAAGDYIGVGKPLFKLASLAKQQVVLSIPETRSRNIHVGLEVRLHLPQDNTVTIAKISELSPNIALRNNALQARIHLTPPKGWHAGGTVIANIVTATHAHAVLVPEESVVLRPNGKVVYVINGEHVKAVLVQTGIHQHGLVEITQGLKAGTTIAHIGAAFLSDGAAVSVVKP